MKRFKHGTDTILVDETKRYTNGRVVIQLVLASDPDYRLTLTINIAHAELESGEFCVKTWAENEELARAALASGLFEDTGKRVVTGFVDAEVWRFKE